MSPPILAALELRGFRNLEPLRWEPPSGPLLLLGDNGAGKTSLLEAIYVAATTRSFRTARLAECVRHGESGFGVALRVIGDRRIDLTVTWSPEEGLGRTLNGSVATLTEHLEVLPVIAWTSADAEVVAGGPVHRRRFLDQGVVGLRPGALGALSRYRRALEQKRELLARGGAPGLAAWNELLASAASEIARGRSRYVERLAATLADVAAACGPEIPPIGLRYRPSPPSSLEGAGPAYAALEEARERELERRAPLVGPHRDELEIRWGEHEVRRVASAGERKLIGLLLTAARGRVLEDAGRAPVYLLDDLDSELDSGRLASVWALFEGASQLLASSNREAVWRRLPVASAWRVERGRPAPLENPREGLKSVT